MFTRAKMIGIGAGALFTGLSVWAGYTYITNLQEKVVFQAEEITKLETANISLTEERAQFESDLEDNKENQEILNEELREARAGKEELIKLFADHDFTNLVNKKPGLIQNLINKGTDKVFKEIEDVSDE